MRNLIGSRFFFYSSQKGSKFLIGIFFFCLKLKSKINLMLYPFAIFWHITNTKIQMVRINNGKFIVIDLNVHFVIQDTSINECNEPMKPLWEKLQRIPEFSIQKTEIIFKINNSFRKYNSYKFPQFELRIGNFLLYSPLLEWKSIVPLNISIENTI